MYSIKPISIFTGLFLLFATQALANPLTAAPATAHSLTAEKSLDHAPPPTNDDPCNAIEIDCTTTSISGSTLEATADEDCGGPSGGAGIWYVYHSEIDGSITLNTCSDNSLATDFDTDISVYTGSCNDLTCLEYRDGLSDCDFQAEITIDVLLDHTYYILIHGWEGEGNFEMSVDCDEETFDCPGVGNVNEPCDDGNFASVNDVLNSDCDCEGEVLGEGFVCNTPIVITELPYSNDNTVSNKGNDYDQSDVPLFSSNPIGFWQEPVTLLYGWEIVYSYTPSENQDVFVDIEYSGFLEFINGFYVMEGCPFNSVVYSRENITLDNSLSTHTLSLEGGTEYFFVVAFPNTSNTSITMNVRPTISSDCPNLDLDFGDQCDDNNDLTVNDQIDQDCECTGFEIATSQGMICQNPLEVGSLPFSDEGNTSNYSDSYSIVNTPDFADDAILNGNSLQQLNGFDVVYSYTPLEDGVIDIGMLGHSGTGSLQVYKNCPFEEGVASDAFLNWVTKSRPRAILNLPVLAGVSYYIVLSSHSSSTPYTLIIRNTDCASFEGGFGSSCDDGDPATTNDVITPDCECEGILPPVDEKCGNPIQVPGIPFFDNESNTANYSDEYGPIDVPPLAPNAILDDGDGSQNDFVLAVRLRGREAVYGYTPSTDQVIDVRIDNIESSAGLYVFTGCPFELTRGYDRPTEGEGFCKVESLPVEAGVTYYIVVSTDGNDLVTPYDLSILLNPDYCQLLNGIVGDSCDDENPLTFYESISTDCECIGIVPPVGDICENPFTVDSLPFFAEGSATGFSSDYGAYSFSPFSPDVMNISNSPLTMEGSPEVVYSYTSQVDDTLDISLTGPFASDFGIWVSTGCPHEQTLAVFAGTIFSDNRNIKKLPITAGVTYYFTIVPSVDYQFSIRSSGSDDCPDLDNSVGDPCDDGYGETINDAATEDCRCVGTPDPLSQCGAYTGISLEEIGPGSWSVSDVIEVSGTQGILADLDVVVILEHPRIDDIVITVTSPEGTTIELISNWCKSSIGNMEVLLDDDSPSYNCTIGQPSLYGSFSPAESLSAFNGETFNGEWTINVTDDYPPNGTEGELISWCLLPTFEDPVVDFCDNTIEVIPSSGFLDNSVLVDQEGFIPSGVEQCVDNGTSVDTWFSFEAITSNMAVRVKGLDDYDIVLETWDACNGERLKCKNNRGEGDRETALYTNCVVGETYYFRVYDAGGDSLESSSLRASVAHFPITRLINADCASNLYSITDTIRAVNPQLEFPITQWTYEFTELEAPFDTYEVISPNGSAPGLRLNQFPSIEQGRSYSVRVKAALTSGFFYGDYGEVCTITILESSGIGLVESDADGQVQPDMVKLKLFPNPINGQEVSVALSNLPQSEGPIIVRVYDLVGRQVLSQRFSSSNNSATFMMNIEELSSGIYTVSAEVEGLIISKKLMIE